MKLVETLPRSLNKHQSYVNGKREKLKDGEENKEPIRTKHWEDAVEESWDGQVHVWMFVCVWV